MILKASSICGPQQLRHKSLAHGSAVRRIHLDWTPKSACGRSFSSAQPVCIACLQESSLSYKAACLLNWPLQLQALKSEGGFVWACKNYDGEFLLFAHRLLLHEAKLSA